MDDSTKSRSTLTRRQRYTIRALQDACIELMQEKNGKNIFVTELCERADINRTTFYRYYDTIEDLTTEILTDKFEEIFSVLDAVPNTTASAQEQILVALETTMRNRKLYRYMLADAHSDFTEKALMDHLTLIRESIAGTGCPDTVTDLCYNYICGGIARLWVNWIESDFAVPKEKTAAIIEAIINRFYDLLGTGVLEA